MFNNIPGLTYLLKVEMHMKIRIINVSMWLNGEDGDKNKKQPDQTIMEVAQVLWEVHPRSGVGCKGELIEEVTSNLDFEDQVGLLQATKEGTL